MLKQTVDYIDFNKKGQRTELYFNLTEFEVIELQVSSPEGIHGDLRRAIDNEDNAGVLAFVKLLVHNGFGIKSADGQYFEKSPEILHKFLSSAAYDKFIMDLFTDMEGKLVPFVNEVIPESLIQRAEEMKKQTAYLQEKYPDATPEEQPNPYEVGFSGDNTVIEVTPVETVTVQGNQLTSEENSEFLAWKKAKEQEEQGFTRPPHESGQGFQL